MMMLRQARERAGLTQQELATRSGVQQQAISQIERDPEKCPRIDTVYALSIGCGCSMYDLYTPGNEKSVNVDAFERVSG